MSSREERSRNDGTTDTYLKTSEHEPLGFLETAAIVVSYVFLIIFFPLAIWFCFKIVTEYERLVVLRIGRLKSGKPQGPGIIFVLPCIDDYFVIDLRTITFDVAPQEILTKDSVTIKVDAVVYYHIFDPIKATMQVENYMTATQLLAQTSLRNVCGQKHLSDIVNQKEEIANLLKNLLDKATDNWGIKVERVEIKDVRLPQMLQRAMAAEAEASREARAKIVAAEGELQASKALKEASDVIAESPIALQLRYLQTLTSIAAEKNSTIIFPIPLEFMGKR